MKTFAALALILTSLSAPAQCRAKTPADKNGTHSFVACPPKVVKISVWAVSLPPTTLPAKTPVSLAARPKEVAPAKK